MTYSLMENVIGLQSRWFRLDNGAKIYPAILNPRDSCVFRVAVNLTKNVDPRVLQQAAEDCKPRFPSFYVRLKSGLFWNYFEANERPPLVKPESPYINDHVVPHANNGYLFTLFYHNNRVSLEVFHGLCDGFGAVQFLKALVFRYFALLGYPDESDGSVLTVHEAPRSVEVEDSFLKNYVPARDKTPGVKTAYRIPGTRFACGIAAINGRMRVEQLSALAQESGATLTQYLAALLTWCILQSDEGARKSKKPINICVPVNMRKFYESLTLRNFSLYFYFSTQCAGRDMGFEEILKAAKAVFQSELDKNKLQQRLNYNVAIEKNWALRVCPLFIKNAAFRIACVLLGDKLNTCALSNFGSVQLPQWMSGVIRDFEINLGVGNVATHSVSAIRFGERITVSFTRSVYETGIEKLFFTHLTSRGVDIELQSNQWETRV